MEAREISEGLRASRIMLVDDEAIHLKLLENMLEISGYSNLVPVQDSRTVIDLYRQERADLILLDLNMPYMDGYDVMAALKAQEDPLLPPIVVLTTQNGQQFVLRALDCGARDYITKPFDMGELLARVRNTLEAHAALRRLHEQKETLESMVRDRTAELLKTRMQVIQKLGRAAEYRDNETGRHIIRVSRIAELIAKHLGWSEGECEILLHAAPMHDLGKIGIPDAILLKPGKLESAEMEIMQTHTTIGERILEGEDSTLLLEACEIALSHHERWDGKGYPKGLAGEAIPLAGRIVALADVFDALTSDRPYKKAWSVDAAMELISNSQGLQFDPALVLVFEKLLPEIVTIRESLPDAVE
jgi:putative two-component system response regulator